jgi:hypothetical protein
VPLLPLVEEPRGGQHLENVVSELVVRDQHAARPRADGGVEPVPVVVGAAGRREQLVCGRAD